MTGQGGQLSLPSNANSQPYAVAHQPPLNVASLDRSRSCGIGVEATIELIIDSKDEALTICAIEIAALDPPLN